MLLVCPSCATSYMIDPASVGASGRSVRCTRCKTQWFAAPPQPRPAPVTSFVADVIAEAEARSGMSSSASTEAHASGAHSETAQAERPQAELPQIFPAQFAARETVAAQPVMSSDASAETVDNPVIADGPSLVPRSQPAPMPDPMQEPGLAPVQTPDDVDIETFVSRRPKRKAARDPRKKRSRLPALIFAVLAISGAAVFWRTDVVRMLPQTASLYSAIGLPVNLRGLTFEAVSVSKETQDGVSVLVVNGTIVSTTDKPVEVPRMRFGVRNAAGHEIYSWTAQPPRSILGAGETLPFKSRLASPPADANSVLVRFVTQRDAIPGAN